jgi:hypothetical protein
MDVAPRKDMHSNYPTGNSETCLRPPCYNPLSASALPLKSKIMVQCNFIAWINHRLLMGFRRQLFTSQALGMSKW